MVRRVIDSEIAPNSDGMSCRDRPMAQWSGTEPRTRPWAISVHEAYYDKWGQHLEDQRGQPFLATGRTDPTTNVQVPTAFAGQPAVSHVLQSQSPQATKISDAAVLLVKRVDWMQEQSRQNVMFMLGCPQRPSA